jgi:hypothetical protein
MELIGDPKFNTRYLAACIEAVMHMPSITHEHFLDLQKLFIGFIDQLVDVNIIFRPENFVINYLV